MTPTSSAPAAWSSSGGKDSMLALLRAHKRGIDVRTMVTVFDETAARNRSHGVPRHLLQSQADALGVRLVAPSATWAEYEAVFIATLRSLRDEGHDLMVFGDIDLVPHREWEEKVCASAGLAAELPLWGEAREAVARDILAHDIRAIVVCTDSRYLDDSFCGRLYDEQFIADLPPGVCPCGENGEFHTFVCASPLMDQTLGVTVTGLREYVSPPEFGSQRYCFAELE
ncbi:MAG: adenosine nucleotide hydrolase [Steroidobacteraceae bacterium]